MVSTYWNGRSMWFGMMPTPAHLELSHNLSLLGSTLFAFPGFGCMDGYPRITVLRGTTFLYRICLHGLHFYIKGHTRYLCFGQVSGISKTLCILIAKSRLPAWHASRQTGQRVTGCVFSALPCCYWLTVPLNQITQKLSFPKYGMESQRVLGGVSTEKFQGITDSNVKGNTYTISNTYLIS